MQEEKEKEGEGEGEENEQQLLFTTRWSPFSFESLVLTQYRPVV